VSLKELALKDRCQIVQSFVARIWLEGTADEDPKWRGHIQYIQGPEGIYFQDLTEMSKFLEQVSGVPSLGFAGHTGKVVEISKRVTVENKK
jgi:hypothetical protein